MDAAAKLPNVTCIYRGPKEEDTREQNDIVEELVREGVDGIAVAVIRSENLAGRGMQKAKAARIPVISYDADFNADSLNKYKELRLAYIGSDNFEIGKMLGEQAIKLRPNGGRIIIQTGRPDSPNLNQRVMGVRVALSGIMYDTPPGKKLSNVNGWTEVREPIPNFGNFERSVEHMEYILKGRHDVDTLIAVAGWSQFVPKLYRKMIEPFRMKLDRKEIAVVVGGTAGVQLDILRDHLSHANVGQNPYEMGRQAILTLYKIVTGQEYKQVIYTPLNVCTPENYNMCTKLHAD